VADASGERTGDVNAAIKVVVRFDDGETRTWSGKSSGGDGLAESYTDKAAKLDETPRRYTWHHLEDGKSMILVPRDLHDAVKHSGGVSRYKHNTGVGKYD
jgi:A nuclease of the HNH/ENDO VII superfamily with conserved WHH